MNSVKYCKNLKKKIMIDKKQNSIRQQTIKKYQESKKMQQTKRS